MLPPSPAISPEAARSSLWRAGAVVGGRYKLRAPIGAGAMGEVWRADHVTLGTPVAVKLVDTAQRDDAQELLARFQLEARAAAQLKSPHVVQILDHGADGRVAFIAMEYLEGESLERRIERRGRLTPSELAHVFREMARGIDRAHAAGIVHRDVKPPNIFIARVDGTEVVKVLDFGIAKMLGVTRDAHLQTQAGFVVGTPSYMSPEQVLGRPIDHRSDLWQMAVIAFECITGKRPFDGQTLGQLFMAICTLPMPVPSAVGPVPPAFDAWFARAASRDPSLRFTSAGEMAEALGVFLAPGGVGESAIPTLATHSRPEIILPATTGRNETWSTARSEPTRRATPVALVAALVLAPMTILAAGGVWWWTSRRPPAEPIAMTTQAAQPPVPTAAAAPSVVVGVVGVVGVAGSASTAQAMPTGAAATSSTVSSAKAVKLPPPTPRQPSTRGGPKAPVDLGI